MIVFEEYTNSRHIFIAQMFRGNWFINNRNLR